MKRFLIPALLIAALGCSSGPPKAEPAPVEPAVDPKAMKIAEVRAEIAGKKEDLDAANTDLAKIASERAELEKQDASPTKTHRMVELGKLESDVKTRKQSLETDLAELDKNLKDLGGADAPKTADDALEAALAASAQQEKEAAEKLRKQKQEEEELAKLAESERARALEEARREREKLGSAGVPDDRIFEERWADVILQVRAELQKYKRW